MTIQKKIMFPFIFGICASMFAQDANVKEKMAKNLDLKQSHDLIELLHNNTENSKKAALLKAKQLNVPIKGFFDEGGVYELQGLTALGDLKYYTSYNAGSRITSRVNEISSGGELGLNLNGENIVIGVWEGIPALDNHQEFVDNKGVSRVIIKEDIPLSSVPSNQLGYYQESRMHSTHVTGTIIGEGFNPKSKGIAPKASVVAYEWTDDAVEMAKEAKEGLLLSNHSYGIAILSPQGYPIDPRNFGLYQDEALVFDDITYKNSYYQPVVAAGNDRASANFFNSKKKGNDLLIGKSLSKNTIVVAAVEEVKSYTGANDVVMTKFSNFGPADDFRVKPDISAKGFDVYSSTYEFPKQPNPITSPPATNLYISLEGTSMASPAVAGVFGLWQQWAIENSKDGLPFKSATIRGIMAHTADEAGNTPGPDHMFGWGLLNAKRGVEVMINSTQGGTILEENTLVNNAEYIKSIIVNNDVKKIIATLAWTDPMGKFYSSNAEEINVIPALVNDLDIVLTRNGEEFLPWRLKKDFNDLRAIKENNDVDNIEKIEIDNVTAGEYTLKINHKGTLQSGKQEYSLIVSYLKEDGTLSTEDIQLSHEIFKIWPNPVNEVLNITIPESNGFEKVSYAIYDITGKLLSKGQEQNNTSIEVPVSELSKGVYFIEIQSNGLKSSTQKFIKN